MNDDPIVASVRRVRAQLAAKFSYDVHAIFADMRTRESQVGDRLVRHTERPTGSESVADRRRRPPATRG